jgi:hypothetical protein
MSKYTVAILVYGEPGSKRNALTEEKYMNLANAFPEKGCHIESVIYNDSCAQDLSVELLRYDAILVWINPIEQGNDRKKLDALLVNLSDKGCYVSAHPEIILKIGTKDVLFKTKHTDFGGDIKLYHSHDDFKGRFLDSVATPHIRILKQYRGNGGLGVFKINLSRVNENEAGITHAVGEEGERWVKLDTFFEEMQPYFLNDGMLIDQDWNPNIVNGMVRCYLSGTQVSGFGYQEVNALFPTTGPLPKKPGKRFYFTQDCGLFSDLKEIMESAWVPQLMQITGVRKEMMPVIWDADFFINKINTVNTREKYTLCEINVSCVSPFPESSIPLIVEEVIKKIELIKATPSG